MDVKASAAPKSSVFDACRNLAIRAETSEEAGWLAALNTVLLMGGTLRVERNGDVLAHVEFEERDMGGGDEGKGSGT